jgi:hypothetical protein
MATGQLENSNQGEITALDIDRAYRLSRLRDEGIGFVRAIETPLFYRALCNTALAMKKKQFDKGAT